MSRIFRIWHRINSLYSWFHRNASWSSTISKPGRTLSWILWYGLCFWACWREPLAWYKSRPWRRIQAILQTGLTLITLYRPVVDIWTYEKILCTYTTNQHRFRNQMKPLISMCLLSIALSSCGQTDNRTECARLLTIRKNSNSDQKIKASEIRMELSKRVKLPPDHVDLFCIHYLGKTTVIRSISTSATSKPLKIWLRNTNILKRNQKLN